MKNVIYALIFLFVANVWAQQTPKNVSEESVVKTVKTNNGSKIIEKKIKVTTREEQNIEFAQGDENKRDKDVVDSPVRVKKTIEIDNDFDNSFDSKTEVAYYEFEGQQYNFKKVNNGFSVLVENNETPDNFGNIVKFKRENHYLFQNGNDTGIGYFNEDGSFTIEYYDKDTRTVTSQEFILIKR
jgi:hypothetical protein